MGGHPDAPNVPGYRELTPLGHGGYSEVYRAYQEQFDRWVALKLLTFTVTDDQAQQRFFGECRVAGRVSAHPNIVTVYDASIIPDGRPYIAMELCERGSVADQIRTQGQFEVAEAIRIAVAMAGALESAHRAGVVHRDVKPGNIMLTSYGQPALTDFGLSIVAEQQEVSTGVDALSPHYAPPEALYERISSPGADVYSLAATTYAMLAGRAPHQMEGVTDDSLPALVDRILNLDVFPVPRPEVPASLQTALHFALSRDMSVRAPSALAFAQALQVVQAELGADVTQPVVLEPPASAEAPSATEPSAAATAPAVAPPVAPIPIGFTGDDITTERELYAQQATALDPTELAPAVGAPVGPEAWGAPAEQVGDWSPPPGDQTVYRERMLGEQPAPAEQLGEAGEPQRPRSAPLVVLLIILIAATAGALVYLLTSDDDDDESGGSSSTSQTTGDTDPSTSERDTTSSSAGDSSTTATEPSSSTAPPADVDLPIGNVTASSTAPDGQDACGTPTSFGAGNVADGVPETAWRASGDATGATFTISLDSDHEITSVGLLPGYAKSDPCDGTNRWSQNRRPTQVTWRFDDGTEKVQQLDDVAAMQEVPVEATARTIELRIDGVTGSPERDFTAISEVTITGH